MTGESFDRNVATNNIFKLNQILLEEKREKTKPIC